MAKNRGLRSSNDAKPWVCRCGVRNKPSKHRFFDLPAFSCRGCNKKFTGDFKFCLGEIKVNGQSLVGEVLDQGRTKKCVPFAYSKAAEMTERMFNAWNGKDPDSVESINPEDLHIRFEQKFPQVPSDTALTNHRGMHKILHMGLILRNEGIQRYLSPTLYTAADISTIPRDDFEKIAHYLAKGNAMVATYLPGKRRSRLRYCQIYKSPPLSRFKQKRANENGHAVVLIGAGMKGGCQFFYFLNSWGKKFCARRNVSGEIVTGGIGKIRATDLTKNVIRLSHPDEEGVERRLEDQSDFDISDKNFILMTATKSQYSSLMAHRGKTESAKLRNVKKYDECLEELKDSWNDGVFHDDEGKCMQTWCTSNQMNGGKMKNSCGNFEVGKKRVKTKQSASGLQKGASCIRNGSKFFSSMPYDQDNDLMEIQESVQQNMGRNLVWCPEPLVLKKQVPEPCPCKEFAFTSSSDDDAPEGLLIDKLKEVAGFKSGHLMSNDGEGTGDEANGVLVQDSITEDCKDMGQVVRRLTEDSELTAGSKVNREVSPPRSWHTWVTQVPHAHSIHITQLISETTAHMALEDLPLVDDETVCDKHAVFSAPMVVMDAGDRLFDGMSSQDMICNEDGSKGFRRTPPPPHPASKLI